MANKKVAALEKFITLMLPQPHNGIFFYDEFGCNWELFQTDLDEAENLQQENADATKSILL